MAKLGEREIMEGLKQGAIIGVGVAVVNPLVKMIPVINTFVASAKPITLGPISLDLVLVGEAIVAAILGNWIISMFD